MAVQGKLLAQLRENSTNNVTVYTPPVDIIQAIITSVVLCNTTGSARTFRLFHDNDGTTYDEGTALFFNNPLTNTQTLDLETYIAMDNSTGTIGYQSNLANGITITLYGAEFT